MAPQTLLGEFLMNGKKIFTLAILLTLLTTPGVWAQSMKKVAQSYMPFLSLEVGARAQALSGAFIAVPGDPDNIFYNPAGLAYVRGVGFSVSRTKWFAGIGYKGGSLAANFGDWGTVGLSLIYMDYGEFYRTEVDAHAWEGYVEKGTFTVAEWAAGLAYAKQLTDRFAFGAQVKYAYQNLGTSKIWQYWGTQFEYSAVVNNREKTMAYDLGTYYHTGFKSLQIGMYIRNFANKPLPLTFGFGMAMFVSDLFLSPKSPHQLLVTTDFLHPKDYSEHFNVGVEYAFHKKAFLRFGYRGGYDEEKLTYGAGYRQQIGNLWLSADYTAVPFGVLGFVHQISLGMNWR